MFLVTACAPAHRHCVLPHYTVSPSAVHLTSRFYHNSTRFTNVLAMLSLIYLIAFRSKIVEVPIREKGVKATAIESI